MWRTRLVTARYWKMWTRSFQRASPVSYFGTRCHSVIVRSRGGTIHSGGQRAVAVGVISKVFRILEAIEATPSGLGLKSICDATRLNKSTAHRFLKHLEREGYLIRADGGKYLIGPKLSQMGARADHRATLQAVSRPILSELWKSTRETVNLATMDQGQVLYNEGLESPHEFRLSSRVGSRRSVHATALGKALAAFLRDTRCEQILEGLNFQALTPKTIM